MPTSDGTLHQRILRHVANHQSKVGMLDLKLVGVTNECANRVPAVKRALDYLTPGSTRCTEYEHIHRCDLFGADGWSIFVALSRRLA